jgi:serine/threonine protein kinase
MKQKSAGNHGRYCLSGKTGTFQNMAPEVAKEWSYNERVDVYSFGVVLWSLLTGKVPFTDMTEQEHLRLVVNGEERPLIPSEGWSRELQDLVTRSWSFFPNARPTMEVVTTGMQFLVSQYQQELDRQRRLQCQRRATLILLMALLGLMVIAFIVAFVLVRGAHVDSEIDHY